MRTMREETSVRYGREGNPVKVRNQQEGSLKKKDLRSVPPALSRRSSAHTSDSTLSHVSRRKGKLPTKQPTCEQLDVLRQWPESSQRRNKRPHEALNKKKRGKHSQ